MEVCGRVGGQGLGGGRAGPVLFLLCLDIGAVVLALDTEGRFVLHRIVDRRDKRLLLRGDGNLQQTETTDTDHVLALMSIARRKGVGYPVTGRVWRIYSRLWMWLFPLRRWLLALFRRL